MIGISLLAAAASARAADIAAYVTGYSEPVAGHKILRAGRPVALLLGQGLEPDDTVIAAPGGYVDLQLRSGPARVAGTCPPGKPANTCSPFKAQARGGKGFGVLADVMNVVSWHSEAGAISARTRAGDRLHVPVLEGHTSRLLAGPRSLHLSWLGGTGPYQVTIAVGGAGRAQVIVPANLRGADIQATLPPGEGVITVTDARGDRIDGPILVAASPLPPPTQDETDRLTAAWALAGRDDGAWLFEATQRLNLAGATKIDLALRDALELGEHP